MSEELEQLKAEKEQLVAAMQQELNTRNSRELEMLRRLYDYMSTELDAYRKAHQE